MTNINITTLGCPKNTVDSSHLIKKLVSEGFKHTDIECSEILLVNTCGFIRDAKEESIEEVLRLATGKGDRKLVVFGCLAKRYREELLKEIPEIDALFGVGEEEKIIEYCKKSQGSRVKGHGSRIANKKQPAASSFAYLKIAEGCNKKCTYCVIPSIRGKFSSVPHKTILKEAEEYLRCGTRELILVAQDITNYSGESGKYDLVSLLKDLASIKGDFRIRLLYLYPTEITDELLDYIASEDKVQKYLDIPFQHSEDKILRLMGRRGTRKEYIKLIRNIRKTIPGVALRTTFIVGFPGETEEDFNGLADFIEEVRFDRLGVFKYSKEEGTPASKLKGQVPEKTKDRRLDEIMKRQALISLEKNEELVGRAYEAIVEEIDEDVILARLYSHAPEIDGAVIIENRDRPHFLIQKKGSVPIFYKVGDLVTVEITDAYDYDLKGRIIEWK